MDTSNICISCGLCCDGTLIGFVQLSKEEIPRLRGIMEIEEEEDKGLFLQPCNNYCGGCTIYSQRPKKCDEFNCGLLKSFQKKKVDFDSANEIIALIKQKKVSIEEKVKTQNFELKSKSFYFKMAELNRRLQKMKTEKVLTPMDKVLILELEQLDHLLHQKFDVHLY